VAFDVHLHLLPITVLVPDFLATTADWNEPLELLDLSKLLPERRVLCFDLLNVLGNQFSLCL
jgi:hypothetical protein